MKKSVFHDFTHASVAPSIKHMKALWSFTFAILFFSVTGALAQSLQVEASPYRKLFPELDWPPIEITASDFDSLTSQENSNKKEVLDRFYQACVKCAGVYKKAYVKSSGVDIVGDYFSTQCKLLLLQLEGGLKLDSAQSARDLIVKRMDAFFLAMVTTPGTSQAQSFQESLKSYNQSILGEAGVSFKSSFLMTQLLALTALIFSIAALVIRK